MEDGITEFANNPCCAVPLKIAIVKTKVTMVISTSAGNNL
jgi:hypothetical protein